MQSLVIGNGESRSRIDLDSFKKDNVLIGCNAIHRDIIVDHLVCCDRRMVDEAVKNPNTTSSEIYVRKDWFKYYNENQHYKNIKKVPELPYVGEAKRDQPEHWGSGGYAVLVAAGLGFKNVSLVGFDLYSKDDKVNNVYKDTANYANSNSHSIDHSYWVYQISKVFEYYPNVKFTIFNKLDWQLPEEWLQNNVSFRNIDELIG